MQFKEGSEDDLNCLEEYSQEEQSLLNSRRRMNCEASERSSQLERDNQQEINEFKREIEERFKLSIANKLYTFPKVIRTISDLLSSSDNEQELPSPCIIPNRPLRYQPASFKKKSKPKESPAKVLDRSELVESVKKSKDKLKTTDSTNKRKEQEVRDKQGSTFQRSQQGKKKLKGQKVKEQSSAFIETIRHKIAKR